MSNEPNPWIGRLLGWWPLLIPLIWCMISQLVMHPQALTGSPDADPIFKTLVYDETDFTAMAMRGLSAAIGRVPGRPDEPGWWKSHEEFQARLDGPQPPFSERFYLEYPTPTVVLFRLGFRKVDRQDVPPTVLDSHQYFVSRHLPRTDSEIQLWTQLNLAVRFYIVVMTLGLMGLMAVLIWGYGTPDAPGGSAWLLVLPGTVFFSLNRFDVLPTLCLALSLALLGRRYLFSSGLCLALGVCLKIFPVLLVPVILRYLGIRDGFRWSIGFALMIVGCFGLSCWVYDWATTLAPIQVQMNRLPELNTFIFYGWFLPVSLAYWKLGRTGLIVLTVLLFCLTRPQRLSAVLRRGIVIYLVFNTLAVFWSTQWMLWFLPLLVPLSHEHRWAKWSVIAQDLMSYLSFPIIFFIVFQNCPQVVTAVACSCYMILRGMWTAFVPCALLVEWVRGTEWYQRRRTIAVAEKNKPDA